MRPKPEKKKPGRSVQRNLDRSGGQKKDFTRQELKTNLSLVILGSAESGLDKGLYLRSFWSSRKKSVRGNAET